MSGSSYSPRIQMPNSELVDARLDSAHPQYTPTENAFAAERLDAGLRLNDDWSGVDMVRCAGGETSCAAEDATSFLFDAMEGSVAAQFKGVGQMAAASFDPTARLSDTERGIGIDVGAKASQTVNQDTFGGEIGFGALSAGTGTLTELEDGRFRATKSDTVTGKLKSGFNSGVSDVGVNGSGSTVKGESRTFTSNEVDAARERLSTAGRVRSPSSQEVARELLSTPESAAEFEPGESRDVVESVDVGAVGKGTMGLVLGGGLSASSLDTARFERTEAGVVVRYTELDGQKGSVTGGVGMPMAKAEHSSSAEQKTSRLLELTLDPEVDGGLIRELEALSGGALAAALVANGAARRSSGALSETFTSGVQGGAFGYTESGTGGLTYDEDGFVGSYEHAYKGQAGFVEQDLGCSASSATFRKGMGLTLVGSENTEQGVGRQLSEADLEELVSLTVSTPVSFEREGRPDIVGEPVAWQELRDGLQEVHALPAEEQSRAAAARVAKFLADGHDVGSLERLFASQGLGQVEQWPASVDRGAVRLAMLEGEESPCQETLADLDVLRGELQRAEFTVPTAKAEMVARVARVRTAVVQRVLAGGTVDAEDVMMDEEHAQLGAAVGRCGAYRGEEEGMYSGVGGEDNLSVYTTLQRFYADWNGAVDEVRSVCRSMGLPEEAWMVSADGTERVAAYEPMMERAQGFHAGQGGMAGDFMRELSRDVNA